MIAVVNTDCRAWLRAMPADSADHTIMDPPYSEYVHAKSRAGVSTHGRDTRKRKGGRASAISREVDFGFVGLTPSLMDDVAVEVARVTQRWALVFCDIESAPTWVYSLRGAGMKYRRTCVWVKPNATPKMSGDGPGSGVEAIVVMHSGRSRGQTRWNAGGKLGTYVHACESGTYGDRIDGKRLHTTPKPLPLMLELLRDFTDEGVLIIDPFAGSGSTGVAALRLGRRFAGCELDPVHARTANDRIEAELLDSNIAARRAGQLALAEAAQ